MKLNLEFGSYEEMIAFANEIAASNGLTAHEEIIDESVPAEEPEEEEPTPEPLQDYQKVSSLDVKRKLSELNRKIPKRAQELVKAMGYEKFSDIAEGSHDLYMLNKYVEEELNA